MMEQSAAPIESPFSHLNRFVIFPLSMVTFCASLTQSAYNSGGPNAAPGWQLFLFGWVNLLEAWAWLANPLLIASWLLYSRNNGRWAFVTALIAVLLSLSFLLNGEVATPGFIPMATGPDTPSDTVESYGYGYWLWVASCVLSWIASCGVPANTPNNQ